MFELIQILYWLALSTWFGGVLFIAIAAPVIFRTVREGNPVMTSVLSVNLEGQHGTLLAGSIIGQVMAVLVRIQLVCAIANCSTPVVDTRISDSSTGGTIRKSAGRITTRLFPRVRIHS